MTSKSDLARAVSQIKSERGYVNVVVANAGIPGPKPDISSPSPSISVYRDALFGCDQDAFNKTYAMNTTSVFYTVAAFLELLDAGNKRGNLKQKSQVIATSSAGSFDRNPPAGHSYSSSKAAVNHIMKQFATGLVPYDIRANVIVPGCKFPTALHPSSCLVLIREFSLSKRHDDGHF